ncbi:MAG TPA: tyrosine--tRNA ligase [Spirochaetales bacterium]|nr:tyrosine--tRNA ligase [Spirochaetales bacterium]
MAGGFEVLKERGFIKQCSSEEGLKRLLASERVTFYIGFDPTGSSLHAGHLLQLFAMSHLQRAGHRPIALIGGGTSRIGDPSGKTEMRKMMSLETIRTNSECFQKQISRFLDFSGDRALMVDNAEWLADLNYIDFLRDIGSHFSVNRMLSFETYKMRLESGLSFIEFNYQILQSFDFLTLYRQHGCRLQMGGDDQWGNIVAGMDLVRRLESVECFALTSPLVTRSDGKKMGKTEKGALFLDPDLISPYEFYQYWLNVPDADVEKLLLLFTYLPLTEVRELASLRDKEINHAKQVLAGELTGIVHGKEAAEQARSSSQALFQQGGSGDMSGIPSAPLKREVLEKGINVLDIFCTSGLCTSRSEARRLVVQGGAYVNGENIRDIEKIIEIEMVKEGAVLLRAGKKRYFRFSID